MDHFTIKYAETINEMLHSYLISTWHYKHQIYEIPELLTALLITYDEQIKDEYEIYIDISWEEFLQRMTQVKHDWITFEKGNMEGLANQPQKTMGGWEGRTIYFIKGGNFEEYWTQDKAKEDLMMLLASGANMQGRILSEEIKHIDKLIPIGREHFKAYEDFIRVCVNFLFIEYLGEAKTQERTEAGNEGIEIRDILAHNKAKEGFFKDLKDKYSCSEILFEAKNKSELTRDDLRQTYCYLKPTLGLWGFIVCRSKQSEIIHSYNRTLHKNFTQSRGVMILNEEDIKTMIQMKKRGRDPTEYLQEMFSKFIRSV